MQTQEREEVERRPRKVWWIMGLSVLAAVVIGVAIGLIVAAGQPDEGPPYDVTMTATTGAGTNDLTVWQPIGDGPWPVVYAIPGSGESAVRDLDVFATEMATHGIAVFGTDVMTVPGRYQRDIECGYRHMLDAAEDYSGDLTQPVTILGYSQGATGALWHGLGEDSYGPEATADVGCPPGRERPDVIVSLNGCHITTSEIEGRIDYWGNDDAQIYMISGDGDTVCPLRHATHAEAALADAGYDVTVVGIPEANHWEVVFHDLAYGSYSTLESDHPAGQATVQAVLDAIGVTTEMDD